jgi:hypothetical protein
MRLRLQSMVKTTSKVVLGRTRGIFAGLQFVFFANEIHPVVGVL